MSIKNKKSIMFVIVFTLIFVNTSQCLNVNGLSTQNSNSCKICNSNKYIIRFKDEPLSIFKYDLEKNIKNIISNIEEGSENKMISQKFAEYKKELLSIHEAAKRDIKDFLKESDSKDIFVMEFTNVFNGIVIKEVNQELLDKIINLPYIESIRPSRKLHVNLDDSIPIIRADDVWNLTDNFGREVTGKDITVAVVDTGIDYNHSDLADKIWINSGEDLNDNGIVDESDFNGIDDDENGLIDDIRGWDFNTCQRYVENGPYDLKCVEFKLADNDPMDTDINGHGTHVAGIIAGVAPDVTLIPYKILNDQGYGEDYWAIAALERSMDPNGDGDFSDHVDIASFSLGTLEPGDPNDSMSVAVDDAVKAGVVVIASAGNAAQNPDFAGSHTITSPGCARRSICVGSTDKSDNIASTSSKGPVKVTNGPNGWNCNYIIKPDVVAPGVSIKSTKLNGGYTTKSGTSMATPHVAGVAALMLQMHPNWNPDEIKLGIRNTAVDLNYSISTQGFGRVDAYNAVNLTEAPPIAIIDSSKRYEWGITEIYGSATSKDFKNYTLYYENNSTWEKIYHGQNEIDNGLLYTWKTPFLKVNDTYKLKLEVKSINYTSVDFLDITLMDPDKNLFILSEEIINESRYFTVNITDKNLKPTKAFIIVLIPHHLPQIRYGSSVKFKSPRIINPFVSHLDAKIIVLKISGNLRTTKEITIINNRFSTNNI